MVRSVRLPENGGDKGPLGKALVSKKMKVSAQKPDLAELVFGNAEIPRNLRVPAAGPAHHIFIWTKGVWLKPLFNQVAEGRPTRLWNMNKE